MKNKNLIASVALFSELYNSESYKSIPDIIAEFIRGAIVYEQKFSFSSTELKDLLKKVYGFDIPESVVRSTLHNKFKGEVRREFNYFHFDAKEQTTETNINKEFEYLSNQQNSILESIYNYIVAKSDKTKIDKDEIWENLVHFLMDNGYSEKYSDLISAFVLSKEDDKEFRDILNSIKEGLILYQGINYTADINQLGAWTNDLTLYLSTEHLFNALGYNGILYKEIFDDFYKLVTEINHSQNNKESKRRKIELRYLEETKKEVDNFFQTAESIKRGLKALDPSKLAMETIVKNCNSPSDIKTMRVQFDLSLKRMGITYQDFDYSYDKISNFNVTDQSVMEKLRNVSISKGREFDESLCHFYFDIFTKINTFRRGNNSTRFEKCGHLYLTETGFAKYLAHHNIVKFKDDDTPFAKDIDFVTTRFWFTLKKGFSNKQSLPKSFDLVTKAKIILSSHLANTVSKKYEELVENTKAGRLTEDEAIALSYSLRERPNTPEEVSSENIDESIDFLQNDNYLESFFREKVRKEQLLESTQKEKKALESELKGFYLKEEAAEIEKKKKEVENSGIKYAAEAWDSHRKANNSDVFLFISIVIANLYLITSAFLIGLSKELKEWFLEFGPIQILLSVSYITILLVDTLGSKYLFKKERVINGFTFLGVLFNYKTYKTKKLKEFAALYSTSA